ncbi:sarcosine oxidase subunit gamma [Bradyrhizobium sp. ISRA443]|uniref:sarcosine oxidase subunit gamma n=1 Tax=unclassified Bradyrhizobium TaxID=2631580 RepID=UPI002479FFF9|nr:MULTISPECIES: sarcosine oxidase subunit gamma family protein [unclassified Bradyrhizobium]WGR93418.1 sarcosine oxidase subunit gamma [Bradyrhizobium sp. ISRA435]WGR97957.1 sarcosine oxidase subunit gamma [Bradyrhizobium sp. ISRA436]WGS04847.1 sarcosine oxidase subunit gamma [Bradyrhizobium sp. ISRA437]WGS11728.1 sarcosine oxidase subunit gamma [Bradyrhizobium sp. ISRA443]
MPEQATSIWRTRDAWAGIAEAGQIGTAGKSGVTASTLGNLGLATLIAAGDSADLDRATKRLIGLDLPRGPSAALSSTHGLVWSGPDQWLLVAGQRAGFPDLLASLSDHAAVSDQSHARAVLRVSGARVREILAKGSMVDLHSSAFPVGATALTSFAHVGLQLWRTEDGPDGAVFEILVPRSMARSFWSWFAASAAEFGCRVAIGGG